MGSLFSLSLSLHLVDVAAAAAMAILMLEFKTVCRGGLCSEQTPQSSYFVLSGASDVQPRRFRMMKLCDARQQHYTWDLSLQHTHRPCNVLAKGKKSAAHWILDTAESRQSNDEKFIT